MVLLSIGLIILLLHFPNSSVGQTCVLMLVVPLAFTSVISALDLIIVPHANHVVQKVLLPQLAFKEDGISHRLISLQVDNIGLP